MIDTHCHLDVSDFETDRLAVLERAWAAHLQGLVVPAIGPRAWADLLSWPQQDARIQVGLGIHPQLLPELDEKLDDDHLHQLDALLASGKAVAVGECGLDFGSIPGASLPRQTKIFRAHLELARKHNLPILVHCLKLHPEMLSVLQDSPLPKAGILLHSYSGGAELAREYLRVNCFFSFAGPVTYPKARKPLDAVRAIPLERLMTETDAPDQTPHPHRPGRCEPAYLPEIVSAMANALNLSPSQLEEITTANAMTFFRCRFGQ